MRKNDFLWSLLMLAVVQAPFIFAFDCNTLTANAKEQCLQIMQSSLNSTDKDMIISNLVYTAKYNPDHASVYQHNMNLQVTTPPLGVYKTDQGIIKDAWLSFLAIMPSVIYNGSLYVNTTPTALSAYGHRVELPQNYYANSYPSSSNGDCKRLYTLMSTSADNRFYVNNQYQADGKSAEIYVNNDAIISSQYQISATYHIDHYKWYRYCCKYYKGSCVRYCNECRYRNDETLTDSLLLTDSIKTKGYDSNLFASLNAINAYSGTTRFKLNYSDSVRLEFKDASYNFSHYIYSINYSKYPYYIYTLEARPINEETIFNMRKEGNYLLIKNTQQCKLTSFDFFNIQQNLCNLQPASVDLTLSTEKMKYLAGEEVKLTISPASLPVQVSYDNQSKIATGSASFIAKPLANKITASYGDAYAEDIIYVSDGNHFDFMFSLSLFGVINYLIFVALGKSIRGIL